MAPSSKKCSCGAGCAWEGTDDKEPCWGEIHVVGEYEEEGNMFGWGWIHACDGHAGMWDGDGYCPPPTQEA